MPKPARTGVLIYAKNLLPMSAFYERVLGTELIHADAMHHVLQSADFQLILHAIPEPYCSAITLTVPPAAREEQAIKPFFTVTSLDTAERLVLQYGGGLFGPIWPGPAMRVRNVFDPEGNILHLRELTG